MLRSNIEDGPDEFELARQPEHVAVVSSEIKTNFPRYFKSLLDKATLGDFAEQLSGRFKVTRAESDGEDFLRTHLCEAVEAFEKERAAYVKMFTAEKMEEYRDNSSHFKGHLHTKCPILRKCLNSKRREMMEWQQKFKYTDAAELADIFCNLTEFADQYCDNTAKADYGRYDEVDDFVFREMQDEEEFYVVGGIGMGLKSTVLYHLHPNFFPRRGRFDLYGLFFLSDTKAFGLPSDSSEFLMINDEVDLGDRNMKMDQNYWYHYDLFSLHVLRLYRLLKKNCSQHGVKLDDRYRYVYVTTFLAHVCDQHKDDIHVMMGGGQDDAFDFYR